MPESERAALYEQTAKSLPVRRVGEASDLAEAYLYLMKNGYVTGTTLVIDGGAVLV